MRVNCKLCDTGCEPRLATIPWVPRLEMAICFLDDVAAFDQAGEGGIDLPRELQQLMAQKDTAKTSCK